MSIPDYVKTEWRARGLVTLSFSDSNCKYCHNFWKNKTEENAVCSSQENSSAYTCSHITLIDCSFSTLNVWEFEEDKLDNNGSSMKDKDVEEEFQKSSSFQETKCKEPIPPTITEETWQQWENLWLDWKDVYVNLSWVKRFGHYCKKETVEWFDNYCKAYPQVLDYVNYCEDIPLENENQLLSYKLMHPVPNDTKDEETENLLEVLFDEFTAKRYWVHFQLYLRDQEIEIDSELREFFASHGIHDQPPVLTTFKTGIEVEFNKEVKGNESETCTDLNTVKIDSSEADSSKEALSLNVQQEQEQLKPEIGVDCNGLQNKDISYPASEMDQEVCEGRANSYPASKMDKEVSEGKLKEIYSNQTALESSEYVDKAVLKKSAAVVLGTSEDILNKSEANQETFECVDEATFESKIHKISCHDRNGSTSMKPKMNVTLEVTSDEQTDSLPSKVQSETNIMHTVEESSATDMGSCKKINKQKLRLCSQSIGVAWALKHIRQLGESTHSSMKDNSTYVFGSCEANNEGMKIPSPAKQEKASPNQELAIRNRFKRKHDQLESETVSLPSSAQAVKEKIVRESNNPMVKAIRRSMLFIQSFVARVTNGILDFILNFIGVNPFHSDISYRVFSLSMSAWWHQWFPRKENLVEKKMKRMEKNSLKIIRNIFNPTVRFFPKENLLSLQGLHITQVTRSDDERETKENLIKVSQVEGDEDCESPQGLYILYLTEEDIDYALEDMVEMVPITPKETALVRTLTIFDDDGIPQQVIKVPANQGKLRCMLEDDYYSASSEGIEKEERASLLEEDHSSLFYSKICFDDEGNPMEIPSKYQEFNKHESLHRKINKMLSRCHLMRLSKDEAYSLPPDVPQSVAKYWRQRFRLFLRYNEGIKIDFESWYSITPEMIAAHQAERCACNVVVDAFCGAGGNAIQLAATCNYVIAIDVDPAKIALAKHNARVYGVEDRIEFIVGDFFQLAPTLKADVVLLCPPWGGMEYIRESVYDVFLLGGLVDGERLLKVARQITENIAVYLPKNSNIFQIIELAGEDGRVDVEFNHISNKRKSMTAYYGEIADFGYEK